VVRRDKVALRTTCIRNVKFKIFKTRTGCQCVRYLYYCKNINWAAKKIDWAACTPGPRVGHNFLKY